MKQLAKKSLPAALYDAYLIASTLAGRTGSAHVFRIDLTDGEQRFFATSVTPSLVGWGDAEQRLPKTKSVRTLKHIATVGAF